MSEYGNSLESKGLKIKKCAFFLWGLVKLKLKAESVCLCERVAAIETDFILYVFPLSMYCVVALEKSTALSVSKGIRGKGRGGHNSQLSHGHMGSTQREREIEKNSTALLLLLITGQRYCQGLFLCSFLFSLWKKFVLGSQKNKKTIRKTLKALLDTIKQALIG